MHMRYACANTRYHPFFLVSCTDHRGCVTGGADWSCGGHLHGACGEAQVDRQAIVRGHHHRADVVCAWSVPHFNSE